MKSFALVIALCLSLNIPAEARAYYGGGHHTTSHGGHYKGGNGLSHRGGKYKNEKTSNQYGRHK